MTGHRPHHEVGGAAASDRGFGDLLNDDRHDRRARRRSRAPRATRPSTSAHDRRSASTAPRPSRITTGTASARCTPTYSTNGTTTKIVPKIRTANPSDDDTTARRRTGDPDEHGRDRQQQEDERFAATASSRAVERAAEDPARLDDVPVHGRRTDERQTADADRAEEQRDDDHRSERRDPGDRRRRVSAVVSVRGSRMRVDERDTALATPHGTAYIAAIDRHVRQCRTAVEKTSPIAAA